MLIKLCFDNPYRNKKSGSPSRQRNIGQNSNVNPVELMRFHPVLNKLAIGTVKLLLEDAKLVKMNPNTLLFGHNEPNTNWYFILFGTLVLHHEDLGALGVLSIEHTVGEESIIKGEQKKLDACYSQKETYLLELKQEKWQELKEILYATGQRAEFLKLDRLLQHNCT